MNSKDRARPLTDTEKELAGEEHQAFLGTPDPCPAFAGHCEAQCDAGGAQSRQHPRLGVPHTATRKHGILLYASYCIKNATYAIPEQPQAPKVHLWTENSG